MAISEPAAKRIKLGSEEVCIILTPFRNDSSDSCCLYFVDLQEKRGADIERVQRSIRVNNNDELPFAASFAYYNSSLYVFGGFQRSCWSRRAWNLDLSPYLKKLGTGDVSGDCVREMTAMSTGKHNTCSVVVGARICVFSLRLVRELVNFELYEPETNQWLPFPDLPVELPESSYGYWISVNYYGVENGELFVQTKLGSYSIDTKGDPKQWAWKHCDLPELAAEYDLFVKRDRFLLSPDCHVYDIDDPNGEPYSFDLDYKSMFVPWFQAAGPLDERGFRTCIAETGVPGFDYYPNGSGLLRVSLVQFDDGRKMLSTSRMFDLGKDFSTPDILVHGIYPLSSTARGLEC